MHRAHTQRPFDNGSSGTTIEVLVTLTFLAASALTVLALRSSSQDDDRTRDDVETDDEH